MNTHAEKTQENKSQSVANGIPQKQNCIESSFQFVDNREVSFAQSKLHEMANNSPKVKQAAQLYAIANCHSDKMAQLNLHASQKSANIQRKRTQAKQIQENAKQMQQNNIIQRFPATSLESSENLDWDQTNSVSRPGEGVSGGVYIFNDLIGPIVDLVVKPEYEEEVKTPQSIASSQVSDKMLKGLGFNVPDSRIVKTSEVEATQIFNVANNKGHEIPKTLNIGIDVKNIAYLKIMGKANAKTFSKAANDTDTVEKLPALLAVLNRPELMNKIGKLIVADAFMQNSDRISARKTNLGNLMFHENELTAIDSSAKFKQRESSGKVKTQIDLAPIEEVFSYRQEHVESLFLGLREAISNDAAKLAFDQYLTTEDAETARSAINEGIKLGIGTIRAFLGSKENRRPLKEEMNRHKEGGATHSEYSRLKTAKRYVDLRAEGHGAAEATKHSVDYEKFSSRLAQMTTFPPDIIAIPVMPPILNKTQKANRFLTTKNADEKRASELKKGLRNGDIDPGSVDLSTLANAGRRGVKLKVEISIRKLVYCMREKTTEINNLIIPDNPYKDKMLERAVGSLNTMNQEVLNLKMQYALLAEKSSKTKLLISVISKVADELLAAISKK